MVGRNLLQESAMHFWDHEQEGSIGSIPSMLSLLTRVSFSGEVSRAEDNSSFGFSMVAELAVVDKESMLALSVTSGTAVFFFAGAKYVRIALLGCLPIVIL